jgi:hypothetical protein
MVIEEWESREALAKHFEAPQELPKLTAPEREQITPILARHCFLTPSPHGTTQRRQLHRGLLRPLHGDPCVDLLAHCSGVWRHHNADR